jgi:hypothetical protein
MHAQEGGARIIALARLESGLPGQGSPAGLPGGAGSPRTLSAAGAAGEGVQAR